MHGLINRAIQRFVIDSYGEDTWRGVIRRGRLGVSEFEAMWYYEDKITYEVLDACAFHLKRSRDEVLEDIGTYLVSHPNTAAVRRLLRFGGLTFSEFLQSLEDLPDRARLAVADLKLPRLELFEVAPQHYRLFCYADTAGWGALFMGVLRAMADDYGTLAYLEYRTERNDIEAVDIQMLEAEFSGGRAFELGARTA